MKAWVGRLLKCSVPRGPTPAAKMSSARMKRAGLAPLAQGADVFLGTLLLLALAAPVTAQKFEASALFGYTTSGGLEPVASELLGYEIGGGFTWQGQFDYSLTPRFAVEASWTQREGALTLETSSGTGELFEIDVRQLFGSVVYRFGSENAKVRPFVLGGLGATFFESEDVSSETKLAWGIGGGAKVFLHEKLGIQLQAKLDSTMLNDESSDFCDPFGFCASSVTTFELLSGVVFRF